MAQLINEPSYDGAANPLAFAVTERDKGTLDMVRASIKRRDVLLAYQPVVEAQRTDHIAFYEGLIRILDETGRVIPARDFIDVVESQELGRQIDVLALECGCQALHDTPNLRLSINMSARSMGYPAWMAALKKWIALDETVPERLILEITESSAMTVPDLVTVFMADLHKYGIAFALDDFGAGFTSFRYLRDFYFDIIKIDGQFIRDLAANPDNQVLTQALISIGQQFDMFTVAESVETEAEARFLAEIGVDCMQGYLFGAPTTSPSWVQKPKKRWGRKVV